MSLDHNDAKMMELLFDSLVKKANKGTSDSALMASKQLVVFTDLVVKHPNVLALLRPKLPKLIEISKKLHRDAETTSREANTLEAYIKQREAEDREESK